MSEQEKRKLEIDSIPANLYEAVQYLKTDNVLREALGEHIFTHYTTSKDEEWSDYISQVHAWETERYFELY
jgi:glutamine synthetase